MDKLLGRYEYEDERSSKFWTIQPTSDPETFLVSWGRIGRDPQGTTEYDYNKASKKVYEKIAKGYTKVKTWYPPNKRAEKIAKEFVEITHKPKVKSVKKKDGDSWIDEFVNFADEKLGGKNE